MKFILKNLEFLLKNTFVQRIFICKLFIPTVINKKSGQWIKIYFVTSLISNKKFNKKFPKYSVIKIVTPRDFQQ